MDSVDRRVLTQHLEALARAGLTHLPVAKLPPPEFVPAKPTAVTAPPPPKAVATVAPTIAAVPAVEAPIPLSGTASGMAPAITPSAPKPVADRSAALKILSQQVAGCTRCEVLASTRSQTVFGVGNPHARILFIGEAPGADEDATGEPFVGRAGQLLNDIIKASRLKREELYICNILKCRPPGNRTPEKDECANCEEYLLGQLGIIDPEYIICWGAVAAQNLLKSTAAIGKLRGKFHTWGRAKVMCTYHPSYLMRNPPAKKDVWEDMKFFMKDLGVDLNLKE